MAPKQVNCDSCLKPFFKQLKHYNRNIKRNCRNLCQECINAKKNSRLSCICEQCGKKFHKAPSAIKLTKHNYCSRSCAAYWRNSHKTTGFRRSKLECFLEAKINQCFPSLTVSCNNRSILGVELDFYFPDIRLAIEINGIVHYEPIYGFKTFERIQNADQQKIIKTSELGIELIIVPTVGHFNRKHAECVWDSIHTIIVSRI